MRCVTLVPHREAGDHRIWEEQKIDWSCGGHVVVQSLSYKWFNWFKAQLNSAWKGTQL